MLKTSDRRLFGLLLGLSFYPGFLHSGPTDKFSLVWQFKKLEFEYPYPSARQADINSGIFLPGKIAPIDTDAFYDSWNGQTTTFITIPRFQDGVPATLGVVVPDYYGYPIIRPFPSWDWNRNPKACNPYRIVSVFRVMVDECGRVWVLDSGIVGEEVVCPPQIMAFDARTGNLISKYDIPNTQYEKNSTFVTPVVDVISRYNYCANTFVYLADCVAGSIVVYDHLRRDSWRVKDKTMLPDPAYGTYTINGSSFNLLDGILGLAISVPYPGAEKRLYYHAMSSGTEHYIKTAHLQTKSLFSTGSNPSLVYTYAGKRTTQSAAQGADRDGVLYFGLMTDIKIACYITKGEFGIPGPATDIVADNKDTLQFASGVKVVTDPLGDQYLWLLTSRFQRLATNTLNPNETNFRIQVASTRYLRYGTKCDPAYYSSITQTTLTPGQSTTQINNNGGPVTFPQN